MVSYEYFMDEMQEYEIELFMLNVNHAQKCDWERARMIMFTNISPYMKRQKTPKELFPLPTDDDYNEHDYEISDNEINTMKQRASRVSKMFETNKNNDNNNNG